MAKPFSKPPAAHSHAAWEDAFTWIPHLCQKPGTQQASRAAIILTGEAWNRSDRESDTRSPVGKLESINTSVYLTEHNYYILFCFNSQGLNEHHHSVLFWAMIQAHLGTVDFEALQSIISPQFVLFFSLQASSWFPFLVWKPWVICSGNMTNPNQSFSPNYIEIGIVLVCFLPPFFHIIFPLRIS